MKLWESEGLSSLSHVVINKNQIGTVTMENTMKFPQKNKNW